MLRKLIEDLDHYTGQLGHMLNEAQEFVASVEEVLEELRGIQSAQDSIEQVLLDPKLGLEIAVDGITSFLKVHGMSAADIEQLKNAEDSSQLDVQPVLLVTATVEQGFWRKTPEQIPTPELGQWPDVPWEAARTFPGTTGQIVIWRRTVIMTDSRAEPNRCLVLRCGKEV